MLTGLKAAKTVGVIAAVFTSLTLYGQDSVNIKPFERYWTKPRLVLKAGVGIQETAFVEAGVQFHKIYIHPLSLASAGPYLTVDGMIKDDKLIVGPKVGYEVTAGLLGVAADFTYYSDFDRGSWVFTPRAGLTIMGFVNLFYGRNFFLSDFRFDGIDRNRFSLVFNLNRDYFNVRNAPKKSK
ncbi:MAG: hypothetical protein WEB30_01865 [Cyclobacteriaceae bacterium]